jgi:hypothetical protein
MPTPALDHPRPVWAVLRKPGIQIHPFRLTLGELEALAGLLVAEFLALDHTGISRQEAAVAERRVEVGPKYLEGACQALHHGARLAWLAAAGDIDDNIDPAAHLGRFQRSPDVRLLNLEGKVDIGVVAINLKLAGALADAHPGDRRLAPAGAPGVDCLLGRWHGRVALLVSGVLDRSGFGHFAG